MNNNNKETSCDVTQCLKLFKNRKSQKDTRNHTHNATTKKLPNIVSNEIKQRELSRVRNQQHQQRNKWQHDMMQNLFSAQISGFPRFCEVSQSLLNLNEYFIKEQAMERAHVHYVIGENYNKKHMLSNLQTHSI